MSLPPIITGGYCISNEYSSKDDNRSSFLVLNIAIGLISK
jgi:hypothetical protein